MADRLDERLQPGERVVYQTRSNRAFVWLVLTLFAGLVVGWGLFFGATDLPFDKVSWLFHALFLAILSWFVHAWLSNGTALVTEHRLLYDCGPLATLWSRQRVYDIPHREIAEIRGTAGDRRETLSLSLTDGRELSLWNVADRHGLAKALCAASGASMNAP